MVIVLICNFLSMPNSLKACVHGVTPELVPSTRESNQRQAGCPGGTGYSTGQGPTETGAEPGHKAGSVLRRGCEAKTC